MSFPVGRRRRCVLAVPGSSEKMAAKAASLDVDQVMLDLEDAVAPQAKSEARAHVVAAINELDWTGKVLSVRVNAFGSKWFEDDVEEIMRSAGTRIDTIVLPKADDAAHVRYLSLMLSRGERLLGRERPVGIEPQIESAVALRNAHEISRADRRVESLTFGPADFSASVGAPVLSIGASAPGGEHIMRYAMAAVVVAARAAGLDAIDGPYGRLDDKAGLAGSAAAARALGYDGKWAIHPAQVDHITRAFSPTEEELTRARRIANRYADAAASERLGAIAFEGELVDAASLALAQRTLRKASAPHTT